MSSRWTVEELAAEAVRALTDAGLPARLVDMSAPDEPGARVCIDRADGEWVLVEWRPDRGVIRAQLAAFLDLMIAGVFEADGVPDPLPAPMTRSSDLGRAMYTAVKEILTVDGFTLRDGADWSDYTELVMLVTDWNGYRPVEVSEEEVDAKQRAAYPENTKGDRPQG